MTSKQKNNLISSRGAAVTEIEYQKWLAQKHEQCKEWDKAATAGTISDTENPLFLFSTIDVNLLLKVASGEICATFLAQRELANRGVDKNGKWVGFDKAAEIHFGKSTL